MTPIIMHDEAGEEAYAEGYAGAVYYADEIVAALLVCAENMGEALAALGYVLLLHLAVGEGSQVLRALIPPAVYGKYLGILVGYDHGRNYYGDYDESKHYKAGPRPTGS